MTCGCGSKFKGGRHVAPFFRYKNIAEKSASFYIRTVMAGTAIQYQQLGWNDVLRRTGSPRITPAHEKPKLKVITREKQLEYGRIQSIEDQMDKRRSLV